MLSFDERLAQIRDFAVSEADKGEKFEHLMCAALLCLPGYESRFVRIMRWAEWDLHVGQDTGIDMVAEIGEEYGGGYCAIQCKCYQENAYIDKKSIDSFIAASGRDFTDKNGKTARFQERLIITTSDNWSANAETGISGQNPPITRLGLATLRAAAVDWNVRKLQKIREKKKIRQHQQDAKNGVMSAFNRGVARGKLIMACGTGKTYTALKIAEECAGKGGSVLFLVPSISLLSQSLNDFAADSEIRHRYFVVCSDSSAGNREREDIAVTDLVFPPTTKAQNIAKLIKKRADMMTVVFATYQSLDVVAQAQRDAKAGADSEFDLIICDEAHRTTGTEKTIIKNDAPTKHHEPHFTKVHHNKNIRGKHRLYMTATPKIYTTGVQKTAKDLGLATYSMDDEENYGKELFRYSFSRAVADNMLADYHVHILCMKKEEISAVHEQMRIKEAGGIKIGLEWAVKMAGCWKAIRRPPPKNANHPPMKRVVAFCNLIKESKIIEAALSPCAREAAVALNVKKEHDLELQVKHVDGTMNALERNQKLGWLRDEVQDGNCRVLTNARCLTEGVDVPALDGVVFFSPRKSQIDIVQAVGRVMRIAPGKKVGNIILPVILPDDATPENLLNKDESYRHVWQVLSALRAHDDRFQAEINKVEFNRKLPEKITVDFTVCGDGDGQHADDSAQIKSKEQLFFGFRLYEWTNAIIPRFVENCGDRMYWTKWVNNISQITESIMTLIREYIKSDDSFKKVFDAYYAGLKVNINNLITEDQAIQTLAQHIITKPVFDALFKNYEFSKQNAISLSMDAIVGELQKRGIATETKILENFYKDVAARADNINTLEGRQNIMETLYNEFFQGAFKKESEQAGIVYTPPEVVDFINKSVDDLLREKFGVGITDNNVHVLDPFTGTGRFIVRLLASDLIADKDLERKYNHEIHVNEKLLLPYYIANVNIEQTYHARVGGNFVPFKNGILCDTFNITEKDENDAFGFMKENKERAEAQGELPIKVILSNPPYSIGQRSANDDAQNPERNYYTQLDESIQNTFGKESDARSGKALYDSYIRAIRWSMNRISENEGGIIGFISNSGFLDKPSLDGLRKTFMKELSDVYVLNLRGDARSQGEKRQKEGGGVFGGGSRTPVAIVLMVKKPCHTRDCNLYYYDIGDYLKGEEKLSFLKNNKSAANVDWNKIVPSPNGDWLDKRDPIFNSFMPICNEELKKKIARSRKNNNGELSNTTIPRLSANAIFAVYSLGAGTNRDVWAYNFSKNMLVENMKFMIENYNRESARYLTEIKNYGKENIKNLSAFFSGDKTKIAWSKGLMEYANQGRVATFNKNNIRLAQYRPFCAKHLYYNELFTQSRYQTHWLFNANEPNPTICVSGSGASEWSCFAVSRLPDLNLLGAGAQCFPFYVYFRGEKHENILDGALTKFREHYNNHRIGKLDIFYYIYAILHHPTYRERFKGNLMRELPRIPFAAAFNEFANIGKALMDLHINYETAKEHKLRRTKSADIAQRDLNLAKTAPSAEELRVQKIRFGKIGHKTDKQLVRYNEFLSFEIPAETHHYKVNGKSPTEWIVDRYKISTDKDSGIQQNPNDWAEERPDYILSLLKKSVTIGIKSATLIKSLPQDLAID